MLEKAIEIEGLLRIIRDGNPLPETYILLNTKASELAILVGSLEEKATPPAPEPTHADFVMAMAATAPDPTGMAEVVFTVQQPSPKEEQLTTGTETIADFTEENTENLAEDLSLIEEDDILLSFDDTGDFSIAQPETEDHAGAPATEEYTLPEPQTAIMETPENKETATEAEEENPTETQAPTTEPEAVAMADTHTRPATEPATGSAAAAPTEKETPASRRQTKLKAAFSLNDRFLYARELFEGNMKMFDSTLDFIEGIDDYSIIEDYFYSELEWDPEDTHVASFMEILRPQFREA